MPRPGQIAYTRQMEPLGLGHAVWCARNYVGNEPFAVLLADDLVMSQEPCLKQMIDVFEEAQGNVVAVMDVARDHTDRYGILEVKHDDGGKLVQVSGLVEKPKPEDAPSTLSVIGRYILQSEVFDHLDGQKIGAGGEIQLTDALAKMVGSQPFCGLRFEGKRFDCGDKVGFFEANIAFAVGRDDIGEAVRQVLTDYSKKD